MWVTKLMISQVKKRIFCPKTTKFNPKLAFLVDMGQAMQVFTVPCWWKVGGCGARAVSRKTPIYFMILALRIIFQNSQRKEVTTRVPCLFVHFVTLFWETIGSYNRAEKVLINLAAATKWYRLSPIRTDLPHKLPEIDTNCFFILKYKLFQPRDSLLLGD